MPEATVREKLKKLCASNGCGDIADVSVLPADPAAGLRSATITFAERADVKKGLKALNQKRSPMGTGVLRARPNNHATVTLDSEMCVRRCNGARGMWARVVASLGNLRACHYGCWQVRAPEGPHRRLCQSHPSHEHCRWRQTGGRRRGRLGGRDDGREGGHARRHADHLVW